MAKFAKHWIGNKIAELGDLLTDAVVRFDPEGSSKAQIDTFEEQVKSLSTGVVKAERELQKDEDAVKGYETSYTKFKVAAKHLMGQVEAAGGEDKAQKALVDGLYEAIAKTKEAKEELAFSTEQRDDSVKYVAEQKDVLRQGQDKLKTAKSTLRKASRTMERAEQRMERAERRSSGQGAGLGSNTALEAMEKRAQEFEDKARATELATGDTNSGASDALQAALEATGGAPAKKSAKDMMADL